MILMKSAFESSCLWFVGWCLDRRLLGCSDQSETTLHTAKVNNVHILKTTIIKIPSEQLDHNSSFEKVTGLLLD